jgi:hypothetical protein
MKKYYGTFGQTFWTLICAVSAGYDWGPVSNPVTHCGWLYTILFLAYISFVLLGLMNILNGIFVNAALQSSAMNRELAADQVMAKRDAMIQDMVGLFLEADEDKSGTVSWDEFQVYLQDEKIKAYFMSLDLDMGSVCKIFDLLDTGNKGELELVEFVEGCINLRGTAKMVDLSILQQSYAEMMDKVDLMQPEIHKVEVLLKKLSKNFYNFIKGNGSLGNGSFAIAPAPGVLAIPFGKPPQGTPFPQLQSGLQSPPVTIPGANNLQSMDA